MSDNVPLECGSGWVSLAAGLVLAERGLSPRTTVWASGAWDRGPAAVAGFAEKLALAAAWGAEAFFVPAWQVKDATDACATQGTQTIRIGPLPATGRGDPRETLNLYLAQLSDRPPMPVAGDANEERQLEQCRKHYGLLLPGRDSVQYYRSHLLEALVRRLRARLATKYPAWQPTHVVTVVSHNPELAVLVPRALGSHHCLLLHSVDGKQTGEAHECARLLGDDIAGTPRPFGALESLQSDIAREVAAFTAGTAPDQVVFDLTPGTKEMTLGLYRAARPGNWLMYIESQFGDRRPLPGTEEPNRWLAT